MKSFSLSHSAKSSLRAAAIALSLTAGVLALQGCATTQPEAAAAAPDHSFIVKGKTTKAQLIEKLGAPTSTTVNGSGGQTLVWGSSVTTLDPKFYIPYIGSLIGGAKSTSQVLTVFVDQKGIVSDFNFTSATQEIKPRI